MDGCDDNTVKADEDFFHGWAVKALIACGALLGPVLVWDKALFRTMNALHSPSSDKIWLGITTLGDGLVLTVLAGALLPAKPRATALALILLMLSSVVVHPIKRTTESPRPVTVMESAHLVGPRLRSNGFPSGHSAAAMTVALGVGHYCRSPWTAGAALAAAALVGLSRVFVGAHFPGDALGGFIVALALYLGARWILTEPLRRRIPQYPRIRSKWFRVAFLTELTLAVVVFFPYSVLYAESPMFAQAAAILSVTAAVFTLARNTTW